MLEVSGWEVHEGRLRDMESKVQKQWTKNCTNTILLSAARVPHMHAHERQGMCKCHFQTSLVSGVGSSLTIASLCGSRMPRQESRVLQMRRPGLDVL
eukprot:6401184-Amphidinium_carterae.1